MKANTILLLLIILVLSSCSLTREQRIEKRRAKKCELSAYKWGCDWGRDTAYIRETVTNTVYRDTTVYIYVPGEKQIDSVPVLITVYKDGTVNVSTKKNTLHTSLATSQAWIENGKLRHTLIQKDSAYKAVIENAIRVSQYFVKELSKGSVKKEYIRYLTWWDKIFRFIGYIAFIPIVYFIYKRFKHLIPCRAIFY